MSDIVEIEGIPVTIEGSPVIDQLVRVIGLIEQCTERIRALEAEVDHLRRDIARRMP